MRTQLMSLFAVAALSIPMAGCPKKGGATPKTEARTCAEVEINMRAQMTAAAEANEIELTPEEQEELDSRFAQIGMAILRSCNNEGWSAEAIDCAATKTGEEMKACDDLLPPGVGDALDAEAVMILNGGEGEDIDDESSEDPEPYPDSENY